MAVIPAVPSFVPFEVPSAAKLAQLAACAQFINRIPAYAVMSGSGQSLGAGIVTALTWTATVDRDAGFGSGTRYTANTGGYYDLSATVAFGVNFINARQAAFQVTTGPANPAGAGIVTQYAEVSTAADQSANTSISLGTLSPYLYPGDYIQVLAWQDSLGSLFTGNCQWQVTLVSLGP